MRNRSLTERKAPPPFMTISVPGLAYTVEYTVGNVTHTYSGIAMYPEPGKSHRTRELRTAATTIDSSTTGGPKSWYFSHIVGNETFWVPGSFDFLSTEVLTDNLSKLIPHANASNITLSLNPIPTNQYANLPSRAVIINGLDNDDNNNGEILFGSFLGGFVVVIILLALFGCMWQGLCCFKKLKATNSEAEKAGDGESSGVGEAVSTGGLKKKLPVIFEEKEESSYGAYGRVAVVATGV